MCIAHGAVDADRTFDGQPRCPVVITAQDDCGYGDPCNRLLKPAPPDLMKALEESLRRG